VNRGGLLAVLLGAATIALVVIGTIWPATSAAAYAGSQSIMASSSTAEAAVRTLGDKIRAQAWEKAYAGLANKAQFTEPELSTT